MIHPATRSLSLSETKDFGHVPPVVVVILIILYTYKYIYILLYSYIILHIISYKKKKKLDLIPNIQYRRIS